MKNFWKKLNKPFSVLAPMEDVTDAVFRKVVDDIAPADVYFTEFVNVEGLVSEGKKALLHRLLINKKLATKSPVVAQIWGVDPDNFKQIAKMCEELGFDGVDINMGCPQRNVTKTGACSALIKNQELAAEIIKATKEGAKNIPVSVKTRIGFNKINTEEWIEFLLKQDINALSIHLRTAKEMSKVPAHWEEMAKIINIRDKVAPNTIIIGNGDLQNYSEILEMYKKYKIDGGMIGRGVFKDMKAFSPTLLTEFTLLERLELCLKHIKLFDETWGKTKKYDILKKYFKIYISEYEDAKNLRVKLMETKNANQALELLKLEISSINSVE